MGDPWGFASGEGRGKGLSSSSATQPLTICTALCVSTLSTSIQLIVGCIESKCFFLHLTLNLQCASCTYKSSSFGQSSYCPCSTDSDKCIALQIVKRRSCIVDNLTGYD